MGQTLCEFIEFVHSQFPLVSLFAAISSERWLQLLVFNQRNHLIEEIQRFSYVELLLHLERPISVGIQGNSNRLQRPARQYFPVGQSAVEVHFCAASALFANPKHASAMPAAQ